jgi:outer membrane biosynthesis protein TonB
MFAQSFEAEERSFRNKKTSLATLTTVGIHALLLLFLIFTILTPPDPPYTDNGGGMTVNFGTDESGMGDLQPLTLTPAEQVTQQAAAPSKSAPTSAEEELVTQNIEDAPAIETPKKPSPKPKPNSEALFKPNKNTNPNNSNATAKTEAPPAPKADPNALFNKGAYGSPNNSKGDGTGTTPGDQGKPTGDPNSKNYLGDGDGSGTGGGKGDLNGGYSLRGRSKLSLPAPPQCSNKGKVVIAIKVDRSGKVTDATFRRFESTVFDQCNVNNALAAARKATFNSDPNAPEVQEGTISYIYKVN